MEWRFAVLVSLIAIASCAHHGVSADQNVEEKPGVRRVITEGEEDSEDDRWKQETAPPYEQVPFDKYFYENVFRYSNIHGILRKHKRLLSSVVDRSEGQCGSTKPYEGFCRKEGRSGTVQLYGHQNPRCFIQCDMYGTAFVVLCPGSTQWNGSPGKPSPYNRCTN